MCVYIYVYIYILYPRIFRDFQDISKRKTLDEHLRKTDEMFERRIENP